MLNPDEIRALMEYNGPASGVQSEYWEKPSAFSLLYNYPNPFNPGTTITYRLWRSGNVKLRIFNFLGREVATLVNEIQREGQYEVAFDASDLASGVYSCRLSLDGSIKTRKMTLLR